MFADKQSFKKAFQAKLKAMLGKSVSQATNLDLFKTLGIMLREEVMGNWVSTAEQYRKQGAKQVYYFSMEFLLGRLMESNLLNLGLLDLCREGLQELGIRLEDILTEEPDAGLGNGGLGRLAACFLDSMAALSLPGHGFGIRYRYGLFEQKVRDGYQIEVPEDWLREGNVWEIRRPEEAVEVKFGGSVAVEYQKGRMIFHHCGSEVVRAVPYDIPVVGFRNHTVNTLRLWSAEAPEGERCAGLGCYQQVVEYKHALESITELLYPDDSNEEGKRLRLKQQYFLVSAGMQNIVRRHKERFGTVRNLHRKVAVHINDTHPALAIPELMRILMDEEGLGWEEAWEITGRTISYTNHTTMSEALEKWPVNIFQPLLPRIYQIVEEINKRFCNELWEAHPQCRSKLDRVAIIADGQVKMAHLAIAGSYSVNGVAALHTEILKKREMKDFYALFPEKFNNKTNGITHRRWLLKANPLLTDLISETIGREWIANPEALKALSFYAEDPAFQERLDRVKRQNKAALARIIREQTGLAVEVDSIFDVQVKRLHAYKRQLLNVLRIMELYNRLLANPDLEITPRTFIFGAKAFPNYHLAKKIVKLINTVAQVVNNDKRIGGKMKVVFLENYRVSLAEQIIPAADLSEQISTASKEASGTGNMKFMLNGALTIGTLDGANVEIKEAVGEENIFIFGLTAEEVLRYEEEGGYCARECYEQDPRLKVVVDQLVNGFLPVDREEFRMIYDHLLLHNDPYFVLKDFAPYLRAQEEAERAYNDRRRWLAMAARNIAQAGRFSSDRTVARYAQEIWGIKPVPAEPEAERQELAKASGLE
ncbi:MAG: glycogen/starch/alpha-glucan phosphorylase, partial [Dethiobacteria bacterium]